MEYTLKIVLLGTLCLGAISGILGSFAMLRRQSLLGDAISHATLPGIGIAFLITQTKNPLIILIGAAIAGWIATALMSLIEAHTTLKKDAILGIILSVFFGLGLCILSIIQRLPNAHQAGLNKFLFGSASTLLLSDLWLMLSVGSVIILCILLFWKEFKLLAFDQEFAKINGIPTRKIELLLITLMVLTIVIGLQTVGVVLMSSMIIAPAASARQWTNKLSTMVFISAGVGALCAGTGTYISSTISKLPTGPVIVVVLSIFVIISLLFAPERGIVWEAYRRRKSKMKDTHVPTN